MTALDSLDDYLIVKSSAFDNHVVSNGDEASTSKAIPTNPTRKATNQPSRRNRSVIDGRLNRQCRTKSRFLIAFNPSAKAYSVTFNERTRSHADVSCQNYTTLLSPYQLCAVHAELRPLCSDLDARFPPQLWECCGPAGTAAVWGTVRDYLEPLTTLILGEDWSEQDRIAYALESYFTFAFESCPRLSVLSTIFIEDFDFDIYYENLGELKTKAYTQRLRKCRQRITGIIETWSKLKPDRSTTSNQPDAARDGLEHFVESLLSAAEQINATLADYYNFLRQPFLDIREHARGNAELARDTLTDPDLGERWKSEAQAQLDRWNAELDDSELNILNLQIEFYKETIENWESVAKSLICHRDFGKRCNYSRKLEKQIVNMKCQGAMDNVSLQNTLVLKLQARKHNLLTDVSNSVQAGPENLSSENVNQIAQSLYDAEGAILSAKLCHIEAEKQCLRLQLNLLRGSVDSVCGKTGLSLWGESGGGVTRY